MTMDIQSILPTAAKLIFYECQQGSDEWDDLHMGIPTASQFHRIMTPAKEQLATGRFGYMYELAVERLLSQPRAKIGDLPKVRRGKELEDPAVRHFEFTREIQTTKVGFITPAHGKWGCSPDRIRVDGLGGVEVKAPDAKTHIEYYDQGPGNNYRCQVQGTLMITGLPTWFFVSFHPNLPEVVIEYQRDEGFIRKLETCLLTFCGELDNLCESIRKDGYQPPSYAAPARDDLDGWRKIMEADPKLWAMGD